MKKKTQKTQKTKTKPSPRDLEPTAHEIARVVVETHSSERTVRSVLFGRGHTRSPVLETAIRDAWDRIRKERKAS